MVAFPWSWQVRNSRLLCAVVLASLCACGGESVGSSGNPFSVCPDARRTAEILNSATYAIVLEVVDGPNVVYYAYGTGFAIARRLIATNAHVADRDLMASLPLSRVLGVQSGTGTVVTLARGIVHPNYTGNPLGSPDVALFTSVEELPAVLAIASDAVLEEMRQGDPIALAGFPADVNEVLPIIPDETVPQATVLTGAVTALHNYTRTVVAPDDVDYIQHQAPTTPGTSGSALMVCGQVVGVNNAGTVKVVVVVGADGELTTDRQAAAANNFGVHAKYLQELITLFVEGTLQGFELPPPYTPSTPPGVPSDTAQFLASVAGVYSGGTVLNGEITHRMDIEVSTEGRIQGVSTWSNGTFGLQGAVDGNGRVMFEDDAMDSGFARGLYLGQAEPGESRMRGNYYEGQNEEFLGEWEMRR